jgi:hypothetical protein
MTTTGAHDSVRYRHRFAIATKNNICSSLAHTHKLLTVFETLNAKIESH